MTDILQSEPVAAVDSSIGPELVHSVLSAHILADGYDLVLDLDRSRGSRLVDARTGARYLDMFTFFASSALGFNHPDVAGDPQLRAELAEVAVNKPSNSDIYSVPQARFVDTFARVLGDPALPHLFFIDGGALAVENALKTAFDWKSRHNESRGIDPALGTRVLHLEHAFHGRSGYTLSLTNTDPNKTARFPTFDWPRIPSPYVRPGVDLDALEDASLAAARAAFEAHPHDIACAIVEPIQGEGGDHHLRPRFLRGLRALCDEFDALLIFDEVQTGVGITGTAWAYQQLGVDPDIVSFGKKTQVCGIMAGRRVDEVPDNVFRTSSRINSTWGGNLTDMVRSRRILEIIERDGLIERAADNGAYLGDLLTDLGSRHPLLDNVRGRGLMRAVSLPDAQVRDRVTTSLYADERVLLLGCGERSVRFRPSLAVERGELDEAVAALDTVLRREGI
ncbi:L-lysine 6-transaminase [Millisia brevis]|uniref:L-lysine 6-transaminase n=1 Tax=Millisia brevis TaxID=264148 RepID=UPI00083292EF|nr:L-lysine 6-transaminase [Millisia brevis]